MSKNRNAQEATERRHIEAFLALAGLKASTVDFADRPDARLVVGGRRVGIEHRELEDKDLAGNAPNFTFLERALKERLKREQVDEALSVAVHVDARAPFFRVRRRVEWLAGAIVTFVRKCEPFVRVDMPIEATGRHLFREGVVGPTLLTVKRHEPPLPEGPWGFVSPGFWGPGDDTLLQAVAAKEELLAEYAADGSLDEVWLLLVTGDRWTQATDSIMTRWTEVASGYDRVYLLDLRTGELQRLDGQKGSA